MIKEVHKCRLCGSPDIKIVFDWGLSPLANKFKKDAAAEESEYPLRYFKCEVCHSVQLKDELSSQELFADYLYESPKNLSPHFNELAKTAHSYLRLKEGDKVLDIGSNNGLLLKEFKSLGCQVCGFEPAENIARKAEDAGIPTIIDFFNKRTAENFAHRFGVVNLVTATNSFAHLSDLNNFIEGLKYVISERGYFIFENAYLLDTIKNLDLGQSYFEHFYLHSIRPLVKLFSKHGMELFKVEYNQVQLGSIRCYVRFLDNNLLPVDDSVKQALETEEKLGLYSLEAYRKFIADIDKVKSKTLKKLKKAQKEGKTVSIYAWPAKMTLISKYFGLADYISYCIEESSVKLGKICPGTKAEIKSLDYFEKNPTDICIIGAYNFEKDIKEKNSWYTGEWANLFNL